MTKILEALNATITCFIEKVENLQEEIYELKAIIESQKFSIERRGEEYRRLSQREEELEKEIEKFQKDTYTQENEIIELKKNIRFYNIELLSNEERIELTLNKEEKLQLLKDDLSEGHKIQAIKKLKDWSHGGLKACKGAIDTLQEEMEPSISEE